MIFRSQKFSLLTIMKKIWKWQDPYSSDKSPSSVYKDQSLPGSNVVKVCTRIWLTQEKRGSRGWYLTSKKTTLSTKLKCLSGPLYVLTIHVTMWNHVIHVWLTKEIWFIIRTCIKKRQMLFCNIKVI